jgi:sugar lactone lactonase YvrE
MTVRGSRPDRSQAITTFSSDRDYLGEAPVWDDRTGRLLRVDIGRGVVIALDADGARTTIDAGGEVSAVIPRRAGGVLLTVGHEVIALDASGRRQTLAIVEHDKPDNRFNDCRCDPQGRLWAGTMNKHRIPATAALYCMAPGRPIEPVITSTTLSNGLGWSPDGQRMYFVDSTEQRIDVFDFDASSGTISDRRCLAQIPAREGLPDGLAVDAEGGVWVCLFGGGQIRRYDETGMLTAVVSLPVTNPTCPAFGGPGLRTLYVTSAQHRLSAKDLATEPTAGAVLVLEPGVAGLPATPFAG